MEKENNFEEEVKKQNKIENEIFLKVKDVVKNAYSKETYKLIETEVRNRNYLPEDWQIGYAVERIQNMITPPAPESTGLFHYVNPANWRISKEELKNQVDNYDTLGFGSVRRVSVILIVASIIMSLVFVVVGWTSPSVLIDILLWIILAIFVNKGSRWAIIITMIYWTISKGAQIVSGEFNSAKIIFSVIFWGIFMSAFWQTYQVERARKKLKKQNYEK